MKTADTEAHALALDIAAGLRAAAEFVENHPDLCTFLPYAWQGMAPVDVFTAYPAAAIASFTAAAHDTEAEIEARTGDKHSGADIHFSKSVCLRVYANRHTVEAETEAFRHDIHVNPDDDKFAALAAHVPGWTEGDR